MMLIMDTREPKQWRARVRKAAEREGFEVHEHGLTYGDYVTEHAMVERKALMDLCASIYDKRFTKQLDGMEEIVDVDRKHGFVLVHGSIDELFEVREQMGLRFDPLQVVGAVSSIVARSGFQLIWVEDERCAAIVMVKVLKKIEQGRWCKPRKREPKKLMSRALGVSTGEFDALLKRFGTVRGISEATTKELQKVFGIGPKKSEEIWRILNEPL